MFSPLCASFCQQKSFVVASSHLPEICDWYLAHLFLNSVTNCVVLRKVDDHARCRTPGNEFAFPRQEMWTNSIFLIRSKKSTSDQLSVQNGFYRGTTAVHDYLLFSTLMHSKSVAGKLLKYMRHGKFGAHFSSKPSPRTVLSSWFVNRFWATWAMGLLACSAGATQVESGVCNSWTGFIFSNILPSP